MVKAKKLFGKRKTKKTRQKIQAIFSLLIEIDTPATSPKTCGKSPGWKKGEKRRKRKTYPVAKKSYSRHKKDKQEAV